MNYRSAFDTSQMQMMNTMRIKILINGFFTSLLGKLSQTSLFTHTSQESVDRAFSASFGTNAFKYFVSAELLVRITFKKIKYFCLLQSIILHEQISFQIENDSQI